MDEERPPSPRRQELPWLLFGIGMGPFVVMSVYLVFSRWPIRWATPWFTLAAFFVGMAIGVYCLWRLPLAIEERIALILIYGPVMYILMAFYTLEFASFVFQEYP